ncbi:MAG: DUF4198 domain-containing protein, partial [Bryobacterales bacterium]|nr:DUF4198 domain-containing protein [Bryobacterales bacterium]
MKQALLIVAAAIAAVSAASAHFPFLVPQPGGATAKLFLSETLTPDPALDASYVAGSQLSVRDAQGHETPLTLTPADKTFTVALPGGGRV